jgi:hypothetical protein
MQASLAAALDAGKPAQPASGAALLNKPQQAQQTSATSGSSPASIVQYLNYNYKPVMLQSPPPCSSLGLGPGCASGSDRCELPPGLLRRRTTSAVEAAGGGRPGGLSGTNS